MLFERALLLCLGGLVFSISFLSRAATLQELDGSVAKSQWNDGAETAYEMLLQNPQLSEAKVKGAYALFQKGYSNAGLVFLKKLGPQEWKEIPQGRDRFVEIVSLFEKKIPLGFFPALLDQIKTEDASPYLVDELRFMKGRQAYNQRNLPKAQEYLKAISKTSRYSIQAHYILGAIAAEAGDEVEATKHFSEVFESSVMSQASEFWKDVGAQMTSHWGANFRIELDAELMTQAQVIGELSLLGLARLSYSKKDYTSALNSYDKLPPQSLFYPKAMLEKVWTLLALNKHAEAQRLAAQLSVTEASFQAVEAHVLRALVLVDDGKIAEARAELSSFAKVYDSSRQALLDYKQVSTSMSVPDFVTTDLKDDVRVQALRKHLDDLKDEIQMIQKEDHRLFPVYSMLEGELELLQNQSLEILAQQTGEHVRQRLADLDRLFVQSKLIAAETFLEEREQLRRTMATLQLTDEPKQREYDEKLARLLQKAVDEIEIPFQKLQKYHLRLNFRQAEILWELGTSKIILGQGTTNKGIEKEGERLEQKSVAILEDLASKGERFRKYDQVLFFLGFTQIELDRAEDGAKTLLQFVLKYPRDSHAPDAYRILADIRFDKNDFEGAENYYKKVLEFPESSFVGYALYKIGWCAYNQKQFGRAVLALEKAYLWAVDNTQPSPLITLQKESRRDLISIYAEIGDHTKAFDYFNRFATSSAPLDNWILELIQQMENNGQYEKVEYLYRSLISLHPSAPENITYQAGIVECAYRLQKWSLVHNEFINLVKNYGSIINYPGGEKNTLDGNVEKKMREVTAAHLFDYGTSTQPEVIKRVIDLNKLYVESFKNWPTIEGLLYKSAQYMTTHGYLTDGMKAYKQHWDVFKNNLKEPQKEEALRDLVSVLGRLEDKNPDDKKVISETGQFLLEYVAEYQKLYPSSKDLRSILLVAATVHLKYGDLENGILWNQKLFDANSTDDVGKKSFKNLAKAYYELKDWKRTYLWAKSIKQPVAELKTIQEESFFLWAENTADDLESARLFTKIANDPDMNSLYVKSLYNAFIHFRKADKKLEAIKTADDLEKKAPHYEGLKEIAGFRAAVYQEAGDYAKALPLLEVFLKNIGKNTPAEVKQQAELNAALISESLGLWSKAKIYFENCLKTDGGRRPASLEEAKRGIERLALREQTETPYKDWDFLTKEKKAFLKNPLPPNADLVSRLKKGALRLQRVSQHFIETAESSKTPIFFSVESFCVLPFLYQSYGEAVRSLGGRDVELKTELESVAKPLEEKAGEFARNCDDRAQKNDLNGPLHQAVLERWGWMHDRKLREKVDQIRSRLEKQSPWIEPASLKESEETIIYKHLTSDTKTPVDIDSWFDLARLRMEKKELGLSRLTFVDALAKKSDSAKLINGYAFVEEQLSHRAGVADLYKKAGELGSRFAWVNFALYHLRKWRLDPALEGLEKANELGAFDKNPVLKGLVQEVTQK